MKKMKMKKMKKDEEDEEEDDESVISGSVDSDSTRKNTQI